jgi:hypothetical protein
MKHIYRLASTAVVASALSTDAATETQGLR